MKEIIVERHKNLYPLTLANGDKYDSIIKVYDDNEKLLTIPFVNTDYTVNYKGGKLHNGTYRFIKGMHRGKYEGLMLFDCDEKELPSIKTYKDLTLKQRTLPSSIINPNHKKMIITYVNIHKGGLTWDYSHGCLTILTDRLIYNYYKDFIELFKMNEMGLIHIL